MVPVSDMMQERYPTGRSVQDRHEYPAGTGYMPPTEDGDHQGSLTDKKSLWHPHNPPKSDIQAIMEAAPHEALRLSEDLLMELWEEYDRIILTLTPREQVVVECVVFGERSLRDTGVVLGVMFPRKGLGTPYSKDTILRIRNRAFKKLREAINATA